MGRKARVGLADPGSLAQRGPRSHAIQADAREKTEPAVVRDAAPGRVRAVAEKLQWQNAYADHDEMHRHADVEAVRIITPIPFHRSGARSGGRLR